MVYNKQVYFQDRDYLVKTARIVEILSINISSTKAILTLKTAKRDYLHVKAYHQ